MDGVTEKRLRQIDGQVLAARGQWPDSRLLKDVEWLCELAREQAAEIKRLRKRLGAIADWDEGSMPGDGHDAEFWQIYVGNVIARIQNVAADALDEIC